MILSAMILSIPALSPQLVTCRGQELWYAVNVLECRTCVKRAGAELRLFCCTCRLLSGKPPAWGSGSVGDARRASVRIVNADNRHRSFPNPSSPPRADFANMHESP